MHFSFAIWIKLWLSPWFKDMLVNSDIVFLSLTHNNNFNFLLASEQRSVSQGGMQIGEVLLPFMSRLVKHIYAYLNSWFYIYICENNLVASVSNWKFKRINHVGKSTKLLSSVANGFRVAKDYERSKAAYEKASKGQEMLSSYPYVYLNYQL